jgi:hypothetical protein
MCFLSSRWDNKTFVFQYNLAILYGQSSKRLQACICQLVLPIFSGNWLHDIDHKYIIFFRVGAITLIWSLCLYRNDKVYNDKNSSLLQYRCTSTLHLWSPLHREEVYDLFTEVCTRQENTTSDLFSWHEWHHNLRIGPPSVQRVY